MESAVIIGSEDKFTTVRLREKSKRLLESVALRKETHEEIILRLVKLARNLSESSGTDFLTKGQVTKVTYARLNKTVSVRIDAHNYDIVCAYNDLAVYSVLRQNKRLKETLDEWEVDLEIVNMRKDKGKWESPLHKKEAKLLYFAALKHVLEDSFDIELYEIITEKDYFDLYLWRTAYKRNKLSDESFSRDVERGLR